MESVPLSSYLSTGHSTIAVFRDASGNSYCALTRHEGEQPLCTITRRIGSREPSLVGAVSYARGHSFLGSKSESVTCIDHEFELLVDCEILHRFAIVCVSPSGEITREPVDLTTHEAWVARVQFATQLLRMLRA